MSEHSGASYEAIASNYASIVDTKPHNALYERPATLSMLPSLADATVLDAGCGPGWYAEQMLDRGARVVSVDYNQEFVAITRARVGDRATVLQADLTQPLTFAGDGQFDLIVCPLVMHYLKVWTPTLREFHRVLQPHGVLVFSTHHPFMDWKLYEQEDYFAVTLIEDDWRDIGPVRFYRRPLTAISQALADAGFVIERLLEPQPVEAMRAVAPQWYERLSKNPWFLVVRAVKRQLLAPP